MPEYMPIVWVGIVMAILAAWSIVARRKTGSIEKESMQQLGFTPCPDQKSWLEGIVTRIENNRGYRYEVRDPRRLPGEKAVYHYVKVRHDDDTFAEQEILFAPRRPAAAALFLFVKPASVAAGLATRLLSDVATDPWDTQPDDLERLEIPPDLKDTNLIAALGAPGSGLYELLDAGTLAVVQGLGDAGALQIRFRDQWCTISGTGTQVPFRLDQVIARLRPLL